MVSEEAFAAQLAARSGLDAAEAAKGGASLKLDMSGSVGKAGDGSVKHADGKHDVESQQGEQGGQGGSALAFRPLAMTFRDVRYSVPFPKVGQGEHGGGEGTQLGRERSRLGAQPRREGA